MFYKNERIALVIDGQALYSAARSIDLVLDYASLRKEFATQSKLMHAYFFAAIDEEAEYSSVKKLSDWMGYNGYVVRTRALRKRIMDDGRVKTKGNMNVQIAMEARDIAQHLDHIVLFTGDGEMTYLVESIQRLGVRVTVCSTIKSSEPMVSEELRKAADVFLELDDLRDKIGRDAVDDRAPRVPGHQD